MAKIEYKNARITDDKGKVIKEAAEDKNKETGRYSWWKAEADEKMAQEIFATIKFMQQHQGSRMEQMTVSTRLYGNTSAFSLMGSSFTRASAVSPSPSNQRISFNLCSSVVDTLTSQIAAKEKIIPTFITSGGKWGMQRKAENLSKFVDGMFYENKVHAKQVEAFSDSGVWGDGLVKVFRTSDDRVGVERILPHTLLVDEVEAAVATPMQMHEVRIVDRESLCDFYLDDKEAVATIRGAGPANIEDVSGTGTAGDLVTVTESYRLNSGKDTKDGLKVICIEDKILSKDTWNKQYFPYPHLRYKKRKLGYWGQGAVERVQNLQGEINRLMILIQKSMWLGGSFKILVPVGSKVVTQHLNNDVGAIIHWSGEIPPSYITPPMIQQDIYPYVDALIEKGYRQEGVSMLNAASQKPMGVDSGKALRTFDDIADSRQLELGQSIEDWTLEVARQGIEVVKDIFKDKKSYTVTWPGTRFLESIDWKDVNIDEDEYVMKAFPTSSLPDDPVGRLQTIQEYMQAGLVSPRAGRKLMRTEDIEMSDALATASEDLICKTIEGIIYDKKFPQNLRPDGNWDLQLAKQLALEYYNFALVNNCPEENLGLLRDFQTYIDEEMGLTQTPASNGQPTPGPSGGANAPGAPLAQPTPTPQSPLLQNTAGAQ